MEHKPRKWISNQLMFWEADEWEQAYRACNETDPRFEQMSGTEQVSCMVGWLMNQYPVSREQLEERKRKIRA